jgi:hypothetical protein
VSVINRGKLKDIEVARVDIPLASLPANATLDDWKPMENDGAAAGSIRLKVTFRNEVILPEAEFAELKGILVGQDLGANLLIAELSKVCMAPCALHSGFGRSTHISYSLARAHCTSHTRRTI